MALQHFNNCVDKTVQAFMEGNASDILKGQIVAGKQKNKKKKSKAKSAPEANNSAPDSSKSVSIKKEPPTSTEESGINGYHVNGANNDVGSVDLLSEGLETLSIDVKELQDPEFATPDTLDRTGSVLELGDSDFEPKSLTMPSIPNAQKSWNVDKSPSRATTGDQVQI